MEEKFNVKKLISTIVVILAAFLIGFFAGKIYVGFNRSIIPGSGGSGSDTPKETETPKTTNDITKEMSTKIEGFWFSKEANLFFKVDGDNYQYGEFATDALISCKINNIKKSGNNSYLLSANECVFENEEKDNVAIELNYNEASKEITVNGNTYKYIGKTEEEINKLYEE